MKKRPVLLAASSGGHLEEILCLEKLGETEDTVLLTEKTDYAVRFWPRAVYSVPQVNRREWLFPLKLMYIALVSAAVLIKERPKAVVSTGALATFPVCVLAKLTGRKLIYIETFAKINTPSLTGRLVYKFADVFIVQWESMLRVYPKAIFGGGIY